MTIWRTRWPGLIWGTIIALATVLPAPAETPSDAADALLSGLIQTNDPGLAVLVARDGKILFEKGYGLADLEHDVPVTPATTFHIGSMTKQFTASAILKLQEEGKLSVDDKLSKYIPDFPLGNEVTLRELLTHTSGIHDYINDRGFYGRLAKLSTEAIIEKIKSYPVDHGNREPYDFAPGTGWRYSNSGFLLLAYIVEKVSGQSYGDFLRENFFQPLGMTNTGVYRANPALPHNTVGYRLGISGFEPVPNEDLSWANGTGSLYSTVEDLNLWNEGIFNGHVLDAASLKAAFTTARVWDRNRLVNVDTGYGFGWSVNMAWMGTPRRYQGSGLRVISHGGTMGGFRSFLLRAPDKKFTVAVLANAWPGWPNADPDRLAWQLVDIFLTHKFEPLPSVNTNISPNSYDALTGRYDLGIGTRIVTISRHGPHLFGQWDDKPEVEIFPRSHTRFFAGLVDARITFVKDRSGRAVKLILHQGDNATVARRIPVNESYTNSWLTPCLDSQTVANSFPQVRILPTVFPRDGTSFSAGWTKWGGINQPVSVIMRVAYQWSQGRIIFTVPEPPGGYDFIASLPQGSFEALQRELEKQFGLVGRVERRETNVLILKVRTPNAPGLKPPVKGGGNDWSPNGQYICDDAPLSTDAPPHRGLQYFLECYLNMPVVDETGLTNHFSMDLKWSERGDKDPNHECLKQATLDQLGLELVPDRRSIDMLVVERAK